MAAGASGSSCIDGRALISFLRNEARTSEVPRRLGGRIRANIKGRIPNLGNGLDEEIVQQTWVHLIGLDKRRVRQSRDVAALAKWFAWRYSVREVFAGYTAPGRKKRFVATGEAKEPIQEDGWERFERPGVRRPVVQDEVDLCDIALARIALGRATESAPRFVAEALGLIYDDGLSLNAAAGAVGVDHTVLTRAIARWAQSEGFRTRPVAPEPKGQPGKSVVPPPHSERKHDEDGSSGAASFAA